METISKISKLIFHASSKMSSFLFCRDNWDLHPLKIKEYVIIYVLSYMLYKMTHKMADSWLPNVVFKCCLDWYYALDAEKNENLNWVLKLNHHLHLEIFHRFLSCLLNIVYTVCRSFLSSKKWCLSTLTSLNLLRFQGTLALHPKQKVYSTPLSQDSQLQSPHALYQRSWDFPASPFLLFLYCSMPLAFYLSEY